MDDLIVVEDGAELVKPNLVGTLYNPTAVTAKIGVREFAYQETA